MAITHLYWRAPYLDLHCPTEAGPLMCVSHAASKKKWTQLLQRGRPLRAKSRLMQRNKNHLIRSLCRHGRAASAAQSGQAPSRF
jgi:hypothetical protein